MTFSRYVSAFSSENKPYTFSVGWLTINRKSYKIQAIKII